MIKVNKEAIENYDGGDYTLELQFIEAGPQVPARLVSYVELGKHAPMFQGKRQVYDSGKAAGKEKPPELLIHLVFEFPMEPYDVNPLCIKTSVPFGTKGEFINKLSVSDALASGKISLSYANRSKYMKYLNAMNSALGTNYEGLDSFVGEAFLVGVTNKPGTKAREDGSLPVYANMKPDAIQSTIYKDPRTRKEETMEVPEVVGTYCPVFDWDNPQKDAWDLIPEYLQKCIKCAVNYTGSLTELMLVDYPEGNTEEGTTDDPGKPEVNKGAPAEADDLPV